MAPRASGLCTSQPQRSGLAPDPFIGLMGNQDKSPNYVQLYIKIYIYKQLDATVFHHVFTVLLMCGLSFPQFPFLQPRLWMAWPALVGFSFTAKCWGQATGHGGTWWDRRPSSHLGFVVFNKLFGTAPPVLGVSWYIMVYHLFLGPIFCGYLRVLSIPVSAFIVHYSIKCHTQLLLLCCQDNPY